jgi:hypothetical protein
MRVKTRIRWILLAGIFGILGCKRHDIVVRAITSPSGQSASIVAYKDGFFGEYSADLVIYGNGGVLVYRTNLLRNRDAIEDVPIEFFSLEIKSNLVILGAKGDHYHGITNFKGMP